MEVSDSTDISCNLSKTVIGEFGGNIPVWYSVCIACEYGPKFVQLIQRHVLRKMECHF